MDDHRIGAALRAIRTRKRWRQVDVAARAGVSASVVGRVERGRAAGVPLGKLRRIFRVIDARLDTVVRFEGAEIARLLDSHHAAMQEAVVRMLGALDGWVVEPEVSFGLRGARHHRYRCLAPKAADVARDRAQDRSRRGRRTAREDGPEATTCGRGGAAARLGPHRREHVGVDRGQQDEPTSGQSASPHAASQIPGRWRRVPRWLRDPRERIDALSFLPERHLAGLGRPAAPVRRVTLARSRSTNRA